MSTDSGSPRRCVVFVSFYLPFDAEHERVWRPAIWRDGSWRTLNPMKAPVRRAGNGRLGHRDLIGPGGPSSKATPDRARARHPDWAA